MVIDISKEFSGYSESYKDDYKLKSDKIFNEIKNINQSMNKKYNYIIIPVSIYNIIECDDRFKPYPFDIECDLRKIGVLGDIECYLDIHLPPDQILISWDKQTARDVKIDNILNGIFEKEKRVKIIS